MSAGMVVDGRERRLEDFFLPFGEQRVTLESFENCLRGENVGNGVRGGFGAETGGGDGREGAVHKGVDVVRGRCAITCQHRER